MIKRCTSVEQPGWRQLRQALWPDTSREQHLAEMAAFLADPARYVQFVAYADDGQPVGLAEASARNDYVNGTATSPVTFLEGIYVLPAYRRKHVAARLVEAVAAWAIEAGCTELASDALLENELSHTVHKALGFAETERVVYFNKPLRRK